MEILDSFLAHLKTNINEEDPSTLFENLSISQKEEDCLVCKLPIEEACLIAHTPTNKLHSKCFKCYKCQRDLNGNFVTGYIQDGKCVCQDEANASLPMQSVVKVSQLSQ